MHALKTLVLAASLAAFAVPASAAVTFIASGNYNLGAGVQSSTPTPCGDAPPAGGGQDVIDFTGSGANNIGLHGYACKYDGVTSFGSRASGENTYSVKAIGGLDGSFSTADGDGFTFDVSAGEVGAFGGNFAAGEFQKASLTIKLQIDGMTYMDLAWSAEVGAGGVVTRSYDVAPGSLTFAVSEAGGGAGESYFSYGLAGDTFNIALADGDHLISYLMTAEASGNSVSGVCSAVLYGDKGGEAARFAEGGQEGGPQAGPVFTSYCGAGARTGDPFTDAIARVQDVQLLPEPLSAGLTLTALLAAAGVRRRSKR
ncbi:MAG: hypothetical protein EOP35_11130 [Rubrivivax sp.]|nr:MAG: hypothetical protein EOP35_11130 [Rubrivivax sp.]